MWELICHHEYCWGTIAADRSPWHSDGRASGVEQLRGETGLYFSKPSSQVIIPRKPKDAWSSMGAVRVEVIAKYLERSNGMLIHADRCFLLRFDSEQEMIIQILGQTFSFRLDDVPQRNWVAITFQHDGVNRLDWSYSYTSDMGLGAGNGFGFEFSHGQVPAVGPQGVWIGSRIDHPESHLIGAIRSVKIWRADPRAPIKNFLARPFKPSQLECWGNYLRKINETIAKDPECATYVIGTMDQIQKSLLLGLAGKPPETIAEFWGFCASYQKLWAAGKAGSAEMKTLLGQMREWLKNENLFPTDGFLSEFLQDSCLRNFTATIGGLECDEDAQSLLGGLISAD